MNTIVAEHFTLTPAIRAHVEDNLLRLTALLPNSVSISVFLSEPAHRVFKALFKIRVWGKDMVVGEEGESLYRAVEIARSHLTRKIVEEKQRWVRLRRGGKPSEIAPAGAI